MTRSISDYIEGPGESKARAPPDDDNDAVEAVVRVLDVAEEPQSQQLEQHLQAEQAGEHHVADLQDVCQLLGLRTRSVGGEKTGRQAQGKLNKSEVRHADWQPGAAAAYSRFIGMLKERRCPRK